MICPVCHGRRLFYLHGILLPCPECEGHGQIHCCDGLQEQPEEHAPPPLRQSSELESKDNEPE